MRFIALFLEPSILMDGEGTIMPDVHLYYHVVWTTKHRKPIISRQIENVLFSTIRAKSDQLKSPVHAINAAYDHVHVAVEISPTIAVSEWVRQVKGVATRVINQEFPNLDESFYWQSSYSARSYGRKVLPYIIRYIDNQKERHKNDDLEAYLEFDE